MSEPEQNNSKAEEPEQKLGIAGNIAKQFINSPVTPLLMFAFLAIGVLGLIFTPRQEDPKISVPMVDIYVQYPGASAGSCRYLGFFKQSMVCFKSIWNIDDSDH